MVDLELETIDRESFEVKLIRCDQDGQENSYIPAMFRTLHTWYVGENDAMSFSGEINTEKAETGYFTFQYSDLLCIPENRSLEDYKWGIEIKSKKSYPVIIKSLSLINSQNEILDSVSLEAGFDGLFINLNDGSVTNDDIAYIKKIGLDIEAIHLPYRQAFPWINEILADPDNNLSFLNKLYQYIDFTFDSDISTVVLHTSNGYDSPCITAKGLNNISKLAEYCNKRKIRLAIENIKKTDFVVELVTELRDYDVGFCFDIGHANAFTKNLLSEEWDIVLDKLVCVHLHDNDGDSDLHLIHGLGSIDFKKVIEHIEVFNKDFNITLELYYIIKEEKNTTKVLHSRSFIICHMR